MSDYLIMLGLRKEAIHNQEEEKIAAYDRIIENMIAMDEVSDDEFNAGRHIQ